MILFFQGLIKKLYRHMDGAYWDGFDEGQEAAREYYEPLIKKLKADRQSQLKSFEDRAMGLIDMGRRLQAENHPEVGDVWFFKREG